MWLEKPRASWTEWVLSSIPEDPLGLLGQPGVQADVSQLSPPLVHFLSNHAPEVHPLPVTHRPTSCCLRFSFQLSFVCWLWLPRVTTELWRVNLVPQDTTVKESQSCRTQFLPLLAVRWITKSHATLTRRWPGGGTVCWHDWCWTATRHPHMTESWSGSRTATWWQSTEETAMFSSPCWFCWLYIKMDDMRLLEQMPASYQQPKISENIFREFFCLFVLSATQWKWAWRAILKPTSRGAIKRLWQHWLAYCYCCCHDFDNFIGHKQCTVKFGLCT